MEFVDRFQALVRNVSVVLDNKPKRERSKCPRCRGSGLLAQRRFPWDLQPGPISNDPCWFCEGIGVMPVAGLSGFMLARASSVFHTRDLYLHNKQLPVKAQLYLGKFPGTRPKIGTYKPCENPQSLLHDFSQPPEWLCGENLQSSESSREEAEKSSGSGAEKPPLFTRKESFIKSPKVSRTRGGSGGSSGQRVRVAPRLSRVQASSPGSSTSSRGAKERLLGEAPKLSRSKPKAASLSLLGQAQNDDQQQQQQQLPASGPEFVRLRAPLLKSPKAFRSSRRGRNRVREEAEKAAAERARRVHVSSCDSEVDTGGGVAYLPDVQADGAWEMKEASKPQQPFLSWIDSSRRSEYSWVNNMIYGNIKERSSSPISAKFLV